MAEENKDEQKEPIKEEEPLSDKDEFEELLGGDLESEEIEELGRSEKKEKHEHRREVEEAADIEKHEEETAEKEPSAEKEVTEIEAKEEYKPAKRKVKAKEFVEEEAKEGIYALRTTANREDQVMDFITSNAKKKKLAVFSIIRPHGMRGYIFIEAASRTDAEQASFGVPYARGILDKAVNYTEIEHMLEQVKREVDIRKNDICEIISGPFKREKAKITRIDRIKEEVVVELLEAAVPIPITVKMDAVKVIRRDSEEPTRDTAGDDD
ncbi:transcription elongation factor Spt5 [Candidatus Woesearchaeota archaeon]|nr:transcription elongation factor Spt5 [Candidatus Woesearchaeota archaeon]